MPYQLGSRHTGLSGMDGETLIILLGGGTKRRQSKDIDAAKAAWTDYKARKRKAT